MANAHTSPKQLYWDVHALQITANYCKSIQVNIFDEEEEEEVGRSYCLITVILNCPQFTEKLVKYYFSNRNNNQCRNSDVLNYQSNPNMIF